MNKKFTRTIGGLTFNEAHNFFFGNINGMKVTMNQVTLKDGNVKWLVKEEMELYEVTPKQEEQPRY
jgi:hypothetical protein